MDDYKKIAQQKYELYAKQKSEQEKIEQERLRKEQEQLDFENDKAEKERVEAERVEAEQFQKLEMEWDSICHGLSQDLLLHIYMLSTLLESHLDFKNEWQDKVIALIQYVNEITLKRKSTDLEEVRQIAYIMNHICQLVEVDMVIEQMDTTEDEMTAIKLAEQEWKHEFQEQFQEFQEQFQEFQEFQEQDPDQIPIASFRRGVGLTLTQLKELSRAKGMRSTGTKEELCIRLSQLGLIRLI